MHQQLALTVLGSQNPGLVEKLTRTIRDSGAGILDSRMTAMGDEFTILMLLGGPWDAIAKIEAVLPRLEKEFDAKICHKRTGQHVSKNNRTPYAIEIVCHEQNGVIHDVFGFFTSNNITLQELYANTYQAAHTQASMFSIHMIVNIPVESSIASVRSDFLEFCDLHNLDAIMEPVK